MKTIKIFLASSEELENDRMAFGNLVRRLDNIYERRGIRVELFEWEDYDAAYNNCRKQDEYNEQIKASDLFLALFHTKAGRFTIEEFDVATEEFRQKASPKVYVYCKDLQQGETESPELAEFKHRLFNELGHYWCRYGNRDTMQLHFVMQLQLVETGRMDAFKVEGNGTVTFDGTLIAHMNKLPYAADNEAFQKMSTELAELPAKIEKARERAQKFPDDEDLRDDLQSKLNHFNQLKKDFTKLQQNLFNTAKLIANLQHQQVSARLRRAIEAFESGNLIGANTLLEEIALEAESHMDRLERHHELLQKDHEIIHQDIDAFQLQAKTVLADFSIPIKNRIAQVHSIYAKADKWAQRSAYDKEKYAQLLMDYGLFLYTFAEYKKAEQIYLRQIDLSIEQFGAHNPKTAFSYINIGEVYSKQGDIKKALEYYLKALNIQEATIGINHPDTAVTYNDIGIIYRKQGNFQKALEFHQKALEIKKQVLGINHLSTAISYNNIGFLFQTRGNYSSALEYYLEALKIKEQVLSHDDPSLSRTYNNLGYVHNCLKQYSIALEYYFKAMTIKEKVLGPEHPSTALTFSGIAEVYLNSKNHEKALEYYSKALAICEEHLGSDDYFTRNVNKKIATIKDVISQSDRTN